MGSLPTYQRPEKRELTSSELPFARACEDMGIAAVRRGHTILVADDHLSSADRYVVRGVARYAEENPSRQIQIELNRPEGRDLRHTGLPANVAVKQIFHQELERSVQGTGTLIPNLAALDASDVLLTVGGKLTVQLMGNIAAHREKGVLAIPAFGGTSAELFERLRYLYKSEFRDRLHALSVLQSPWSEDSGERTVALAEALQNHHGANPTHSYFLSYSWKESEAADHVEVLLQRSQRIVNRDESLFSAGIDLSDIVKSLIQESDTFVGLWSQRYAQSTWCPQELEYALNRQGQGEKPRRVLLVMLDDEEAPIRLTGKLRMPGKTRETRELSIRRILEGEGELGSAARSSTGSNSLDATQ